MGKNHIFCPVGEHRGCGLVERTIQTIKRRLGVNLNENNNDLNKTIVGILESLRTSKQATTKKSPFELHFGRKPNTLMSNTIVKLSVLDKHNLERPLLSREDTKSNHYSKDRLIVVEKRRSESEARPLFPKSVSREEKERLEIEEAIIEMSIARERWAKATRHLSGMEQSDAAREFVNRNTTYRANFKLAAAELGLGLHLEKSKSKFSKDLKSKLTPAHASAPTVMQGLESTSSDSSVSPPAKKKKSKQVKETP